MKRTKSNRRKAVKRQTPKLKLPKFRFNLRALFIPPLMFGLLLMTFVATKTILDRPVDRLELLGAFQRVTPIQVEAALVPALDRGFLSSDLA